MNQQPSPLQDPIYLDPIYLDYNATTPVLPEVVEAMLPYLSAHFGNPSSGHIYGQRAMRAVEQAREQVAALIGAKPDEIIFTSGGTESNNLAIRGLAEQATADGANIGGDPARRRLLTSTIEHPATAGPCARLERHGFVVDRVGVDAHGRLRLDEAIAATSTGPAGGLLLVTIMHANNETGVLQPLAALAEASHRAGAFVHSDAAQSVGKVPVSVDALGVDLLSIAGHKLYAPKGVGALYCRRGTPLGPFTLGAGHERGLRPGTENVASIVGLGVACAVAGRDLDRVGEQIRGLRDRLWSALAADIPGLRLNGHPEERLPNTLSIRFPAVLGESLLAATPEIASSTGSACHAGHHAASAVILAMGVPAAEALGTVRLSLGRHSTETEVDRAAVALIRAWRHLQRP